MKIDFSRVKKLSKKKVIIGVIIVAILALSIWYFTGGDSATHATYEARTEDLTQEVSVTGKVKPTESADLALDVSGRAVFVNTKVGDKVQGGQILAQLFNDDLRARLGEAEAALKSQEAKLNELKRGSRPEDIQISQARVDSAQSSLADARNTLKDKIQDAYIKADDAVRSKTDIFFINPRSISPRLNLELSDSGLKSRLEAERINIESILTSWNDSIITDKENITLAKTNTAKIGSYLDQLALAINSLASNSSLAQTTIDTYKADVFSARTNISTTASSLSSAEAGVKAASSNLDIAQRELTLKQAGATQDQLSSQEALVDQARAGVSSARAQLSKTMLFAPISGVVTRQDIKKGEFVTAGKVVVSVISNKTFKIETDVPEADIAKINVGDTAKVTLDAYGDADVFEAFVTQIDPAETIIEGVSTYGVALEFAREDERIRSGMTANIDILTEQKSGALAIPQRAVAERNGSKFVKILQSDESIKEVEVKTGLRGSSGNIEILEGLNAGDKVITSTK